MSELAPPLGSPPTDPSQTAEPSVGAPASLPVETARCLFCTSDSAGVEVIASGEDYEYGTTPDRFDFERCIECDLVFIQPRPTADAMATIYPSNYYAYNEGETESPIVKPFRDFVERTKVRRYADLVERPEAEILDIGCADGRLLEIIQRFGPPTWKLAGLELGEGAAQRAAERGFEVRTGDFESMDLDDWTDRFDLALLHHVIEHTRAPRASISKAHSLLRRGGLLSVETPELAGWDYHLFQRRYWGAWHIPRHFYLFDRKTLSRLLEEEGFEIVSVKSILSPAFWIHSVANWLSDRGWGRPLAKFVHTQNLAAVGVATSIELLRHILNRPSSNLQILARKV
jgi:SAM-dependent methyltransferase